MEQVIRASEKYVSELLLNELPSDFLYHNLTHTKRVVNKVKELAQGEKIEEQDLSALLVAAWFHDVG
ncbi:MAG: HD domain-containing protein, partial [Bacteroidia bacterium]|nr:HD domain-containing protein [Bacteroidia bacterium]